MAENYKNDPILSDQTLKKQYFLIANVTGPIQVQKSGKKIPTLQNPPNKLLWPRAVFIFVLLGFLLPFSMERLCFCFSAAVETLRLVKICL